MKRFLLISFLLGLLSSCSKDEVSVYGGIYGTIRNAETGAVVYNAEITLAPGHTSPVTGTNGTYEFTNLEARQYTLTVRAHGFMDDSRQVMVVPGESTQCDVLLTPERDIEGVSISTKTLNFGSALSHLSVTLSNTGNTTLNWYISTPSSIGWLTISPMSGTTDAGKSSEITVSVDRSLLTEDASGIFIINAAGGSKSVTVYANKGNGGDNNGDDNSGNGGNGAVNVTNGLYAYYMFNGNLLNAVDGAPNGQGINNPTYVAGVNGSKALKLSVADNSYVNIPEAMIDRNTFSISFWIKGLADGHLFHVPSNESWGNGYIFTMQDGRLTFWSQRYWYYKSYNEVQPFTHPTIQSEKWNMITLTFAQRLTYDKGAVSAKLYINGEFVDVVDIKVDCLGTGTKFVFGGKFEDTTPPSISIDNLRVYNSRALSDAEVKQIYNYEK